jgi:hypothetical protein
MRPPDEKAGGTFAAAGPKTDCAYTLAHTVSPFKPDAGPMFASRSDRSRQAVLQWQLASLAVVGELLQMCAKRRAGK